MQTILWLSTLWAPSLWPASAPRAAILMEPHMMATHSKAAQARRGAKFDRRTILAAPCPADRARRANAAACRRAQRTSIPPDNQHMGRLSHGHPIHGKPRAAWPPRIRAPKPWLAAAWQAGRAYGPHFMDRHALWPAIIWGSGGWRLNVRIARRGKQASCQAGSHRMGSLRRWLASFRAALERTARLWRAIGAGRRGGPE